MGAVLYGPKCHYTLCIGDEQNTCNNFDFWNVIFRILKISTYLRSSLILKRHCYILSLESQLFSNFINIKRKLTSSNYLFMRHNTAAFVSCTYWSKRNLVWYLSHTVRICNGDGLDDHMRKHWALHRLESHNGRSTKIKARGRHQASSPTG